MPEYLCSFTYLSGRHQAASPRWKIPRDVPPVCLHPYFHQVCRRGKRLTQQPRRPPDDRFLVQRHLTRSLCLEGSKRARRQAASRGYHVAPKLLI
eukprot:736341-Hanusia_phi.AAC.6